VNPSNLFWRDEILQVMYWLRGEGILQQVRVDDLKRFLHAADEELRSALGELVSLELVVACDNRFELTESGVKEGRRRFVDEFEPLLRQGHYECNEPDCDCHSADFEGTCHNLVK
jgi:hypothetical protein